MFRENVRQKQKASCAFPLASAYEERLNSSCSISGREGWEVTNYSPKENRAQNSVFITHIDYTLVDSGSLHDVSSPLLHGVSLRR